MTASTSTYFCIICGREFHPRDADTVICPDCGGPPEALAPSQLQGTARIEQPKGTVLAEQPHGTGLMGESTYQRLCIICGQDFAAPDPQADRCPQCRGEAPRPQGEIISKPESAQPTPAMPARTQGTVAAPESSLQPAPSSAADIPLEWNAGDVILDLYEVKGELGKGGMGVVYRVHHRQWNLDLAVKTPLSKALQKAGGLENFIREAQAWVDLGLHPHIVTCYYVRRLGEAPRVFAECMEGGSLKDWIKDGRLYAGGEQEALKRILDVAIQFAWGLGYAHEKGLVHQDVKPGNALMTPDGMLKVTDFGLVGAKGYTRAYAAPEQELGQAVSPRTDIWCWGVSVLEMFTGEVRWGAGSVAASVLESYLQEAPLEGIPPMPAALAELLRQCFQNDPAQRPASMDEVAERLVRLYEQETGTPYPRQKPKALELRAASLNNRAVSLLDLGKLKETESALHQALEADPLYPEATYNLSLLEWRRGEIDDLEVVRRLENVLKNNPQPWPTAYLLALVHLERGDIPRAKEMVAEIKGHADVDTVLMQAKQMHPGKVCLRVLEGHTKIVTSVAFSPDEQYALSGSGDGTLRLWDVRDGRCLRVFSGHTDTVKSVAFSPDGRTALSGSDDCTLRLWEIETGRTLHVFRGHRGYVNSVAFSPDGLYAISGSGDETLRLWNIKTGASFVFDGHTSYVTSATFNADGHYVLSGSDDETLKLWDTRSQKCLRTFRGHTHISSLD